MTSPGGNEVGRISIRAVPDTSRFRKELAAKLEAIEEGLKVKVKVVPDTTGLRAKIKAATSNLPDAKVNVDVDHNILQRSLARVSSRVGDMLSSIKLPKIPLGSFADSIAFAALVAAFAAPAIALLTGALAALPAVLAGIATPIGVIALGLDGIKKAAEVLQTPLDNLKKSISGVFETRLTPVFEKLAGFLPKLDGPLQGVANGLSDMAQSFVDTISAGPGLARIQGTIDNIARSLSDSAPGIGSFTNGLLGLAQGVSAKFPAVVQWFNDAGTAFSNWVDRVLKDGSLDRAMTNLGNVLKPLMDLGGDVLKQGFDWLQDPKFGESMSGFVEDMQVLVNTLAPQLKNLFTGVAEQIEQIRTAIDEVVSINPFASEEDRTAARDRLARDKAEKEQEANQRGIGEAAGVVTDNLGKQTDAVVTARTDWEKLKEAAKIGPDALGAQAGQNLRDQMNEAADQRGANASKFWGELFDGDADMAKGLWDKVKTPFDWLKENTDLGVIDEWVKAPIQKITETLGIGMAQAGADAGEKLAGNLGQGVQKAMDQGLALGPSAGGAVSADALVGPAIEQAKAQLAAIGPMIQAAMAPLQQVPAQIQQAFSGIGAAVTGSMATVVSSVAGAAQQIVAAFSSNLAQIPGIATATFGQVAAAASAGMAQVVAQIQNGANQAVAAVQAMGQQIIAALQSAAAGAQAAGAAVGQGMASGIRSSIGAAVAAAQELASAVAGAAKTDLGIKSPSKVFAGIGGNVVEGLNQGIEDNTLSAVDKAKSLAEQVTKAMNDGLTGVQATALTDQLKASMDELELQRKGLKVESNAATDPAKKKSLQDQMKAIQVIKDQLALQKDQLKMSEGYGQELGKQDDMLGSSLTKMMDIGKGFAMANLKQFQSDIGIEGGGALTTLADIGLDWGTGMMSKLISQGMNPGTTINVNSVDEALTAKQTLANKQALQYTQRGTQ